MRSTLSTLMPAAVLSVGLLLSTTACGADPTEAAVEDTAASAPAPQADALVVEDPWVRATTDTEDPSMTAAFMTLDNEGDQTLTVVGAASASAGMVQLHEMTSEDGRMVMQEMAGGLELAPGRGQLLQPGGRHVMLMDLSGELAPGDEVTLTLELADGSEVEVTAPVKAFTEEEGHYHEPGTAEHSHGAGDDHGSDSGHDH